MKYFFTLSIVCVAAFAQAQIISIPDINFKKQIIEKYDTDNDGELQNSEALAIENLNIQPVRYPASNECGYIDVFPNDYTGLEKFTNLQRFSAACRYSGFQYTTGMIYNCVSGPATPNRNLSFRNNIKLKSVVYTGDSTFSGIDLSGCTNLDTLRLSGFPGEEEYGPYNHNFDNLDLSGCKKLRHAFISYFFGLKNLNVQGCDSLKDFYLYGTGVSDININGLPNLEVFLLNNNSYPGSAVNINASNAPRLYNIGIVWPEVNGINVSGCSGLLSLYINTPNFSGEYLDLSGVPSVKSLSLYISGGRLSYLNLKNGTALDNLSTAISVDPPIQYICADDFETENLRKRFLQLGQHVNVNPYCNFGPSGKYNTITGVTRINTAGSTCDNTSPVVKMMPVKIADNSSQFVLSYTDVAGNYKTYTGKGGFKVTPYFPYPYYNINPVNTSVIFDTANSLTAVNDFCIIPDGIHNDLEITFLPLTPARPGFDATYQLAFKNRGTTTLSGNVQVNFDNSKMNYVSASENVITQNAGQLVWSYTNLKPFESKTIEVTFNILPPPVNNIGDTIYYLTNITPSTNDETTFDNSFILPQRIIGSFDPNDKQCLEGSKLDISKISRPLHYVIRFQNEGTDTAFNIVVADTLSANLNANSFEFTGSSHPCEVRQNGNKLEFIFENIKLPYKAINEPGSHGFVAFSIKAKPTVVINDSINNKAAIYFDFNLPVITNTATTIVSSASNTTPVKLEYFSLSNSSNANTLNWKASCTNSTATFTIEKSADRIHFSIIGTITANEARCQQPFSYTDNAAEGKYYYRIKITDADGKSFYSKVLTAGKIKTAFEIKAIASNQSNTTVYFSSSKQQSIQLKIIAADGKAIYNSNKTIAAGNNSISLQIKNAAGIYTMFVYTKDGEVITKRFIK